MRLKLKARPILRPGIRGGRWRRTPQGEVRYDQPGTGLRDWRVAEPEPELRTPVDIDTEIAELTSRMAPILSTLMSDVERLQKADTGKVGYRLYEPREDVEKRIAAARVKLKPLTDQRDALDAEYRRRRWSRFYRVTNGDGHVHSSTHCSTCFSTTRFAWLIDMSGMAEDDAIKEYGELMCTICYPKAPVSRFWGEGRVAKEERAAKEARLAEKRAKSSAAADKGVARPGHYKRDGTPELWFKTERAAYEQLQRDVEDLDRAARDRPAAGFPDQWVSPEGVPARVPPKMRDGSGLREAHPWELMRHGWRNREASYRAERDHVDKLAGALAEKHGSTIDDEVAIARDKDRWPKIVRAKKEPGAKPKRGRSFRLSDRSSEPEEEYGKSPAPPITVKLPASAVSVFEIEELGKWDRGAYDTDEEFAADQAIGAGLDLTRGTLTLPNDPVILHAVARLLTDLTNGYDEQLLLKPTTGHQSWLPRDAEDRRWYRNAIKSLMTLSSKLWEAAETARKGGTVGEPKEEYQPSPRPEGEAERAYAKRIAWEKMQHDTPHAAAVVRAAFPDLNEADWTTNAPPDKLLTKAKSNAARADRRLLVACGRCGGSGRYGPTVVEGGRCFKCLGSGRLHAKFNRKTSPQWAAAAGAWREYMSAMGAGLDPRDPAAFFTDAAQATLVPIREIETTGQHLGAIQNPSPEPGGIAPAFVAAESLRAGERRPAPVGYRDILGKVTLLDGRATMGALAAGNWKEIPVRLVETHWKERGGTQPIEPVEPAQDAADGVPAHLAAKGMS